MPILADYEGLGVAVGLALCTAIMLIAFLFAIGGIVAASVNPPWRNLARGLAFIGILLTVLALAAALGAYWEERNHVNAHGEHFRPSPLLWISTAFVLGMNMIGFVRSFSRRKSE